MRFRLLNRLRAFVGNYFWLPCALCGKPFGGHEWKEDNDLMLSPYEGRGVCPDCADEARRVNRDNWAVWMREGHLGPPLVRKEAPPDESSGAHQ
jgi:recombinational DNA repair protein (RecF pathway)